ncbi:hypothetical protein PFICI_01290 [Pestalotiopsis fici W106-1]|uniref:Xylanolytic transcriptional activator regulatory domain-containing protein n=1 Tax=Pestalotiopsis fici (strain W106-1 / CGMCC3.15140) TaxID=1229662 RepID=W3XPM0_PESFW|nr:uncharacterized protein PFICI_01290 [Pestalotiopsis fici W106-1]ETS87462.1 hypothetical protein PFICI_01290 [Pestalotiopsis fici W106-1]
MAEASVEHPSNHNSPSCQAYVDKQRDPHELRHLRNDVEGVTFAATADTTENLFRDELGLLPDLPSHRVETLESALSLVTKFAQTSQRTHNEPHKPDLRVDVAVPDQVPAEVFFLLLNCDREHRNLCHWPDHISVDTLERMCKVLGQGTASLRTETEYKVCVFSKAFAYINRWLRICAPGPMTATFQRSLDLYAAACLKHLKQLDLISPPNLATLQALLCGAGLVSLLGKTSQAWSLTALASRLAINLHYHTLTQETLNRPGFTEVRHFVYWCYYMDKTLSTILIRPSSLPNLRVDPTSLVSASKETSLSSKIEIMVKLAQIQDLALPLVTKTSGATSIEVSALVDRLEEKLYGIRENIDQLSPSWSSTPALQVELDGIYFMYYSVFTTLLRLHPASLHDPRKRGTCLQYARNALLSMGQLRSYIESPTNTGTDYVSWSIILYPLTPFFIVFCNVVATSNQEDVALLRAVTDVMGLINENCSTGRCLHNLFSQFVDLCSRIDSNHDKDPYQDNSIRNDENRGLDVRMQSSKDATTSFQNLSGVGLSFRAPYVTYDTPAENSLEEGTLYDRSIWDDSLMLQLFNTQPSIDWFEPTVHTAVN